MWWLLKWLGHEDIAVLDGGIDKWTSSGLSLETTVQQRNTGTFSGEANNDMWVDINFVQKNLQLQKINLLDARSSERFTAKDSKTDPIAGHVPGAMSFPFVNNLSKQGVFLPVEELQKRFSLIFSSDQNNAGSREVINMCGSGVTACHNLLAMSIAGLPMTRLFVGSWSEWIKDKSRPVAVGEV
jgi:thiosulfate/3-mercaptopyruvate sulfurtransferase